MAVVAAWRTGPTAWLAAGAGWFGAGEDGSLIRRVSRCGFRLAAKELAFTQPELGTDVFEFGLKFRETGASALMHGLPVTGLLAEFEVFGEQRAGVAAWQWEGCVHSSSEGDKGSGPGCAATFIQPVGSGRSCKARSAGDGRRVYRSHTKSYLPPVGR